MELTGYLHTKATACILDSEGKIASDSEGSRSIVVSCISGDKKLTYISPCANTGHRIQVQSIAAAPGASVPSAGSDVYRPTTFTYSSPLALPVSLHFNPPSKLYLRLPVRCSADSAPPSVLLLEPFPLRHAIAIHLIRISATSLTGSMPAPYYSTRPAPHVGEHIVVVVASPSATSSSQPLAPSMDKISDALVAAAYEIPRRSNSALAFEPSLYPAPAVGAYKRHPSEWRGQRDGDAICGTGMMTWRAPRRRRVGRGHRVREGWMDGWRERSCAKRSCAVVVHGLGAASKVEAEVRDTGRGRAPALPLAIALAVISLAVVSFGLAMLLAVTSAVDSETGDVTKDRQRCCRIRASRVRCRAALGIGGCVLMSDGTLGRGPSCLDACDTARNNERGGDRVGALSSGVGHSVLATVCRVRRNVPAISLVMTRVVENDPYGGDALATFHHARQVLPEDDDAPCSHRRRVPPPLHLLAGKGHTVPRSRYAHPRVTKTKTKPSAPRAAPAPAPIVRPDPKNVDTTAYLYAGGVTRVMTGGAMLGARRLYFPASVLSAVRTLHPTHEKSRITFSYAPNNRSSIQP
ncbi:hypothetical protein K438DRAFT_1997582 [Mycena galopus ATCC 62051]|nr:hypothetical protein K438DRAFT_1997582 [Mycena galopus ATCC 62051]